MERNNEKKIPAAESTATETSAAWIPVAGLKHRYLAGNQEEFLSPRIAQYGCGLIGFADLILYLTERDWQGRTPGTWGRGERSLAEQGQRVQAEQQGQREQNAGVPVFPDPGRRGGAKYEAFIQRLDRSFSRVYSGIGLNGFSMAAAFNRRARKRGWPWRARWAVPERKLLETVKEMLDNDIPVILSVGPGFRGDSEEGGVALYRDGTRTEVRARDHYVTVIGLEEKPSRTPGASLGEFGKELYFRVVSWGKEYRISVGEYMEGTAGSIPLIGKLFSNVLYIRRR